MELLSFGQVLLLNALLGSVAAAPTTSGQRCGYDSCPVPKPDMLNVHLLAHTHMDLGWLKTVDQYYYGTQNYLANAGVQYIFDSVLSSVEADPRRRFIFVETGFFDKWWRHRNDSVKARFNSLVQSGRMEFISGGWVMSDEACTHYSNTIDQMTYGIRRLKDIFGDCGVPKIGWQIDPFGHSREYASLLAQMGMDGYFFGRLDYQDKDLRESTKKMEFVWQASANLGKAAEILTGILPNTYSPPPGFCFDVFCDDSPIVDDQDSEEYNVDSRVSEFVTYATNKSAFYATNNIPVTMGNDFNYQSAPHWFDNLDKLIGHVNAKQENGSKVNLLYSTPSCYLKALHDSGATWPTKSDDFFPYASDPHAYWTGYFTSRPTFKFLDRYANNIFQAAKQIGVLAGLDASREAKLNVLREALAVAQHHDAVSGTAKQAVTNDYVLHLARGLSSIEEYAYAAYDKLIMKDTANIPPHFFYCHTLNMSACKVTETADQVAVIIYNPQAKGVTTYVTIPVALSKPAVTDGRGDCVETQVLSIPDGVKRIPERMPGSNYEIVFRASLPPLGFETYFVETEKQRSSKCSAFTKRVHEAPPRETENDIVLKGKNVAAVIDGSTGLLKQLKSGNVSVNVKQSFYWYSAMAGNNSEFQFRASGAYIFRPNGTEPVPVGQKAELDVSQVHGKLVKEVRQKFSDWLTQVIRVYGEEDFVEFDWVVGSIPVDKDGIGKEVITRFDADLETHGVFYTDSNGREILKRKKDSRPTWDLQLHEPVSGNYYPVNSRIFLRDEKKDVQLTVLTDRSQGGSSLYNGSLELMVHRRLLYDDAFGVGEALNETYYNGTGVVVRGKHRVLLSNIAQAARQHRELGQRLYMAPVLSFAKIDSVQSYMSAYKTSYTGVSAALPPNVHLLTLERWTEGMVLLRLEHFYEKGDRSGELSEPVRISLQSLFHEKITSVHETFLAASKLRKYKRPLSFKCEGTLEQERPEDVSPVQGPEFIVELTPMQIRTFIVEVPTVEVH